MSDPITRLNALYHREGSLSCLSYMTVITVICAVTAGPVSGQSQAADAPRPTVGGAVRMSAGRLSEGPSAENWRDPLVWGGAEVISNFIQREPVEGVTRLGNGPK